MTLALAFLVGLATGSLLLWWILQQNLRGAHGKLQQQQLQTAQLQNKLELVQDDRSKIEQRLLQKEQDFQQQLQTLSRLEAQNRQLSEKMAAHDQTLASSMEQMQLQFKNMANAIFEDKSKSFSDLNRQQLDQVLQPLRERLKDFETQVQTTHKESIAQQAGLFNELKHLKELNQQMSTEARNLTKALKGENKTQGNWGEVVLLRILERSGLTLNQEYRIQESLASEDGRRQQPDVTILLPEQKYLVIDSKVSLLDYERFVSSEEEAEQQAALKRHLQSMRKHVQGLSGKAYDQLYGAGSPDFVLLFVPIEPAFIVAVQNDPELFNEAFDKNIVLVSTSTLLATLRTIASIWRQENQNRNAQEIARQAGSLYDKFTAFAEDLKKVGNQIELAGKSHESAMNKLVLGKDNLVRKAERLRELGAKTTKQQEQRLLDEAEDNEPTEN
jgi:DNA recombination protein RmuC